MRNLTFLFLFLSGCGTTRIWDVPKVQSQLSTTLQKSESLTQKSQADFAQKKRLVDNLAKSRTPDFVQAEPALRTWLSSMEEALREIVTEKKNMADANSEIAALSYTRPIVRSYEREYPQVEDAVRRFEKAVSALNSSVLDYSRESNSLADLIAEKSLYESFDVAEFQKRVQQSVTAAQENLQVMQRELNRAAARGLDDYDFDELRTTASKYETKAQRLPEITRQVNDLTTGAAQINSLDPNWSPVQKLVAEFETLTSELSSLNTRFTKSTR